MPTNDNPLFALIPGEVLRKAKSLAEEFRAEFLLKELVGRHILAMVAVVLVLLFCNGANGLAFLETSGRLFPAMNGWLKNVVFFGAIVVWLGGMMLMYNALIAWLEVIVHRRMHPESDARIARLRFYRRSTWLPLIPISAVPALANAFFDFRFFVGIVVSIFALIVVYAAASRA